MSSVAVGEAGALVEPRVEARSEARAEPAARHLRTVREATLTIRREALLPRLGWFATYVPSTGSCDVEVGSFVDVDSDGSPRWVVAGLWDGDFGAGDFHTSEYLFGSGLWLDDQGLHVVPSSATLDRCVYVRQGDRWFVSNSLVVLLGRLGARPHPDVDHRTWGEGMCFGVLNYRREIPVVHPQLATVNQLLYESMLLKPDGTRAFSFRDRPHQFKDYADYLAQMRGTLRRLWTNATDERRRKPARAATTTSKGYDSPAVTAFVSELAPGAVSWTSERSNTRIPRALRLLMPDDVYDDDGTPIARYLGCDARTLDPDLSRIPPELEAWCWASAQVSPEIIFHAALSDAMAHDAPTVLFTGQNGDRLWNRELSEARIGSDLVRAGPAGSPLMEARLVTGMIECPVPYLFARSGVAVHAVTTSAEMKPWTLGTAYDRPIPRRLLEEKGVPRAWFGFGKKAVAQDLESPQGEGLRRRFFADTGWSAASERLYRGVNLGLYLGRRTVDFARARGNRERLMGSAVHNSKRSLARWVDLQRDVYLTCTDLLARRFAR